MSKNRTRYTTARRYIVAEMDGTQVKTAAVIEVQYLATQRVDEHQRSITLQGEVKAVKQADVAAVHAFGVGVVREHLVYRDVAGFDYDGDLTTQEGDYPDEDERAS